MKYLISSIFVSFFLCSNAQYANYFNENALRIEYVIAGNSDSQQIFLHALKKSETWGGPVKNLFDSFD